MQAFERIALVSAVIVCCAGAADTAGEYPLTMNLNARAKTATTTVTSEVTVHVELIDGGEPSQACRRHAAIQWLRQFPRRPPHAARNRHDHAGRTDGRDPVLGRVASGDRAPPGSRRRSSAVVSQRRWGEGPGRVPN